MARRVKDKTKPEEDLTVLKDGEVPEVAPPAYTTDSEVVADAKEKNKPRKADAPPPIERKWWRVTRGGYVLDKAGYRTKMREGKELDNLNYDIKRLKSQGIRLEEIPPEERVTV